MKYLFSHFTRLYRRGNKYDFVGFCDVMNVKKLEKKLDSIFVGILKIRHINEWVMARGDKLNMDFGETLILLNMINISPVVKGLLTSLWEKKTTNLV